MSSKVLELLASEKSWLTCRENGVNSLPADDVCWNFEIVRFGVVGRKSNFAAEEKKSPVNGTCRSGVFGLLGVLKGFGLVAILGLGVLRRAIK